MLNILILEMNYKTCRAVSVFKKVGNKLIIRV